MKGGKVAVPGTGYGLVYGAIWDSSIAANWEAAVMLMVLLSLADREDVVWMGLDRLERKTGMPRKVVEKGLRLLLDEDPSSRSKTEGGRRIVQIPFVDGTKPDLSEMNPRGFFIVNRAHYKKAARRLYNRQYMRDKRASRNPSQSELSGNHNGQEAKQELEDFRGEP